VSEFQPTLDFTQKLPPAVQERIAEGMQQADENANARWKHVWDGCVLAAARRLHELTSDDVLEEFEKLNHPPGTHNMSAIGPAMKRAWKMGILSPTDRVVRSLRKEKQGNRHNIWISKYCGGKS
jgi:hypothetical protein